MNLKTAERIVSITFWTLLCLFLYGIYLGYRAVVGPLFGYEPKLLPLLNASGLRQVINEKSRPVVVYFYYDKADQTSWNLTPVLEEFATRYNNRISFYRYRLDENASDITRQYGTFGWTIVLFVEGKETVRKNQSHDNRDGNRGLMFLLLRNYLGFDYPYAQSSHNQVSFISEDVLRQRLLDTTKLTVVDFTSAGCPACQITDPVFQKVGESYADLADFYFVQLDDSENKHAWRDYKIRATPTIAVFYNRKEQSRITGMPSYESTAAEAIVGMLLPYLQR